MAGEKSPISKAESRIKKKAKDGLLWVGEHSPKLTIPLTGVIFLAGAITTPIAATLIGIDVGQNKLFKRARSKEKSQ